MKAGALSLTPQHWDLWDTDAAVLVIYTPSVPAHTVWACVCCMCFLKCLCCLCTVVCVHEFFPPYACVFLPPLWSAVAAESWHADRGLTHTVAVISADKTAEDSSRRRINTPQKHTLWVCACVCACNGCACHSTLTQVSHYCVCLKGCSWIPLSVWHPNGSRVQEEVRVTHIERQCFHTNNSTNQGTCWCHSPMAHPFIVQYFKNVQFIWHQHLVYFIGWMH